MDNITHSLIGYAMARASTRPDSTGPYRRAALWTCLLGNNLADTDTLCVRALGGGQLDTLLHHRGYTHTLALAPAIGLMSAAAGAAIGGIAWWGGRQWSDSRVRRELGMLLLLGVLSALMHLVADSWNDYGVHPFWPFLNRWFYGDSIFILEPALWMAMLPLIVLEGGTRWGRAVAIVLGLGLLGAAWGTSAMIWPAAAALTIWAGVVLAAQRAWKGPRVTFAAILAVLVVFGGASAAAKREIRSALHEAKPAEELRQLALSPAPGDPVCWRVETASRDESRGEYVARVGNLSLLPALVDPMRCHPRVASGHLAALQMPSVPDRPGLVWTGEFRRPLDDLARLTAASCRFEAFRRFARVPFWQESGGEVLAGDLRYDLHAGPGFADVWINPSRGCVRDEPPWIPPFP